MGTGDVLQETFEEIRKRIPRHRADTQGAAPFCLLKPGVSSELDGAGDSGHPSQKRVPERVCPAAPLCPAQGRVSTAGLSPLCEAAMGN